MASSFDMRPCCAWGCDKPGALCIKHPAKAILHAHSGRGYRTQTSRFACPPVARRSPGVAAQEANEVAGGPLGRAEAGQMGTPPLAIDHVDVAARDTRRPTGPWPF